MSKELEQRKEELRRLLYNKNEEKNTINKINVQKSLFNLLREGIKEKEYEIEIGSYIINITPEDLSVKYETDETTVELSNKDIYYESTRDIETRFFAVTNENKDTYNAETTIIKVDGLVNNVAGDCEEIYTIELFGVNEDNIANYLQIPENATCTLPNPEDPYLAVLKRTITRETLRRDFLNYFKPNTVIPVIYKEKDNIYIRDTDKKVYNPQNYSLLIPTLEDKKNITSFLYSSIVEFYTEYIANNL